MSDLHLADRPLAAPPLALTHALLFARHGATHINLAGQRCGGDIDPPLAPAGIEQAHELARSVAACPQRPGLVVTSDLLRTHHTARIVCDALGGVELVVLPALRERSLGFWNLEPIDDTEAALARGDTPPCGESAEAFRSRIEGALALLRPLLPRQLLIVGSKGVGRVLRSCIGLEPGAPLLNGELVTFNMPR